MNDLRGDFDAAVLMGDNTIDATSRMIQAFGRHCMPLAVFTMVLSSSACGDYVTRQEKSVPIGTANFGQCVTAAVAGVRGVSVNREHSGAENRKYSIPESIGLDVTFEKPIPYLEVQVLHPNDNTALIRFTVRGDELDEERKEIAPVLQSIADAVSSKCGIKEKSVKERP